MQPAERGWQVDEGRADDEHQRDDRRGEEAAVDGGHAAAVVLARGHEEDAEHRGDHADHRHDQREHQALRAEGDLAEDQGGDQGDGVGLKQVSGHACAVAHVVADVVGDRGRIPRVVFGDVLLNLANQVSADVSGLGEDTAADAHEHGKQGGAEAKALQHAGRVALIDKDDHRGAEQAKPDSEHACHAAGAERDPHGRALACLLGRGRDPDVAADSEPHASEAGDSGEQRPDKEEDRTAEPDRLIDRGQHE